MSETISTDQRLHEFSLALDHADDVIGAVPAERWDAPSPCEQWSAAEVVAHITGTLSKALTMLTGQGGYGGSPAEASTDPSGAHVVEAWDRALASVADALAGADLTTEVQTPRGTQSLAEALALPTSDLSVHAWDVAAASGGERDLPSELIAQVRRQVGALPEKELRRPGLFGPAREAPDGASETDQLMAWLGRRVPEAAE